jgi:hypothetical protein
MRLVVSLVVGSVVAACAGEADVVLSEPTEPTATLDGEVPDLDPERPQPPTADSDTDTASGDPG